MTTAVIIVAAGSGSRLGSPLPKAFVPVAGAPMLQRALGALTDWTRWDSLVLVVPEGYEAPAQALATGMESVHVVVGGETRGDSVQQGLAALPEGTSYVLIHDAARALMPPEVFDRVLDALESGAKGVIPHVPVVDTLVTVGDLSSTQGGVNRDELGSVQTPQGFGVEALVNAYASTTQEFTDDAAVLRSAGHEVLGVEGHPRGFKITYPDDLLRAESLLGSNGAPLVAVAMDVHQFDSGEPLRLAGLDWPGEPGLSGHSDGDAVLHAIVDAILNAAGLGDLGTHFGSARPEFAGANSQVFLDHTLGLLKDYGLQVSSVAVQVVAESPKIGPRREEAETTLSALVGAPVSLSATTTDGLGFTGRGEGLLAIATAVLRRL
ncbi:MAG: 2-C-methyl-D-erythritol 4-phosphate cytidylyltransferase [Actinomycetota bacterium]|nr:2-C-methyl-D-erythritol 4-phosphate cytidylyltransferase [Actinomycetota bacterium]